LGLVDGVMNGKRETVLTSIEKKMCFRKIETKFMKHEKNYNDYNETDKIEIWNAELLCVASKNGKIRACRSILVFKSPES
jgi:hypothetical protein